MTLTQKKFLRLAGDRAVIWITPARVSRHAGTKWPLGRQRLERVHKALGAPAAALLRPMIKAREPLLIPAGMFGQTRPLAATDRYLRIRNFIEHVDHVGETEWFRDLHDELERNGLARHKSIVMKSPDEIRGFLNDYVGNLVRSLARDGFRPEHGGFASTAVVDADGALCKSGSGNHRFNIAHVLGLPTYPLRIVGLHEDFVRTRHGRAITIETILDDLTTVAAAHRV